MGYLTEFNWVLKVEDASISDGESKTFQKAGRHVYPVGMRLILVNSEWEPHSIVEVTECRVHEATDVTVQHVRALQPTERAVLGNVLKDMYGNAYDPEGNAFQSSLECEY
ncbi:MAG: hypothetical protein JW834_03590 [Candidatus Diapherotrites archaeon]|nr:hypothetical protein [Candidatus Diapherotrites archaeon]